MLSLLARPWLRLPHLLAIYATIAVGAPCAFFIVYELTVFLRSFESFGEYLNPKAVLLALVVIALLIIPYLYNKLTHRKESEQYLAYSPELATQLTSSLLATTFGLGMYLREREHAQTHKQMLDMMHFMIKNVERIALSDENFKYFQEMKTLLERSDGGSESEFYILLTRFIERYQEAHPSQT
jgi:hypothetical protein